jgi:hypothetical protein
MTSIEELEQRIKEGEILLAQERVTGWAPLVGSLVIALYLGTKIVRSEIYLALTGLALLYLGFNVWRVIKAQKNVKDLEAKIQEYRDKKAKLENPGS